jgi:mycofactocin system glycosyltransferase
VRYQRIPDGKAVLTLLLPLKAVFIPESWQPVVTCLSSGRATPLAEVARQHPHIPQAEIEEFLNQLVRKGYLSREGVPELPVDALPRVSIIVPVRNRPAEIAACLDSLSALDYPEDRLEIIVVDDASEDDTPRMVAACPNVRMIRQETRTQAAACRNRAARDASGEILAFIDSDCLADPHWLRELVPAFRDPSIGAVGGLVDSPYDENRLDRYEKVKSALRIGAWFKRSEGAERFFYVPTCNFLVRRDLFLSLAGFREKLHVGEDVDFCWRLQDQGSHLEYQPLGKVLHKHRNRLTAFCARRFDYGTSEPILQGMHPDRIKTLYLPLPELLFWIAASLAAFRGSLLPLPICLGILAWDWFRKYGRLRARRIPISRLQVLAAVNREYLSFVHHVCSFFSRYYLVLATLILPFFPRTAIALIGMHLIAGFVEYRVKKPRLSAVTFIFFFSLEQAAYQAGVWWECFRRLNFNPVLPRIIHKRQIKPTRATS